MKSRCPKCGAWTDATEQSILDNAKDAYNKTTRTGEKIGKFFGKPFGRIGETVGGTVGDTVGTVAGVYTSIIGGVFGDKYQFKCPNCGEEWGFKNPTDETGLFEEELKQKEAHQCESVQNDIKKLHTLWKKDVDKESIKSLITEIEDKLDSLTDSLRFSELCTIAVANYLIDESRKALSAIEKAIKICDGQNAHCIRGLIKYKNILEDPSHIAVYDVLKDMKYVLDKEREDNDYFSEDILTETWEKAVDDYIKNFLAIQSSQRRFICLKDSWDIITDEIKVLPISRLPEGINFPTQGHPKKDVLYMVHPLRPNTYFPADNIDFELFRDQMREFTSIMVSLGAKYLRYYDMQDSSKDESKMAKREIGGNAKIKVVEVAVDYQSREENAKYSHFKQELEEKSEFLIGEQVPKLPDETRLAWYKIRSDWQEKVESRLRGVRFRDKFRVSTYSEESIDGKERLVLEAEMKYLLNSVSTKYDSDFAFSLKRKEDRAWSIEVEFYPLEDYKKGLFSFIKKLFRRLFS